MQIHTLVREGMDTWAFRPTMPCLSSPFLRLVHQSICRFVRRAMVQWRMTDENPECPFADLIGWYGHWEVTGTALFVFSVIAPDAGGQIVLIYSVQEDVHVRDPSVPDVMTSADLIALFKNCQDRQNKRVCILSTKRVGVCADVYYHLQRENPQNHCVSCVSDIDCC